MLSSTGERGGGGELKYTSSVAIVTAPLLENGVKEVFVQTCSSARKCWPEEKSVMCIPCLITLCRYLMKNLYFSVFIKQTRLHT